MQLRVMSEEECSRIHEATLKVLEKTGVWFKDCPEAHEIFVRHGCQVENDGRVLFPSGLVMDALASVPDRATLTAFFPGLGYAEPLSLQQGKTHFGLIGNAYYVYDYAAGQSRDCLETDVRDKLLLLDMLPNFEYDCCNLFTASERGIGQPVVVSYESLDGCVAFLQQWVYARAVSGGKQLPLGICNSSPEESRLTVLGHAILAGPGETQALLEAFGIPLHWCNPQSPLQYKAEEANAIIRGARNSRDWSKISPEVMMGATGPVTMAGALVQHNAEVLAGVILAQLACPGAKCIYGCVSAPMDLRNAEITHGNFETALFNAAVVQLADRYGLPARISPGNTSDRQPGARALAETAVGLYLGAAAGGNIITTGLLDSTLMISYEHMVMVDELINQLRCVTGGIATDAESLALEVIAQFGHPGGEYLTSEHTRRFMKRDVYYSDYCGRIKASYEDSYDKAHRRVKEILAQRESNAHVDSNILTRLAAVEARLKENDKTWRTGEGDWWTFYVQDL